MKLNKHIKLIGKILLWILGLWLGVLLIIQIVLLPPIFTRIANGLAGNFFDAEVSIGRASGSIFSHFPRITFTVEDLEITYPHQKFAAIAQNGPQQHFLYSGCGEKTDTLASIKKLSTSISVASLLVGDIKLPHLEMESPKIYAHYYDEDHVNWDIFASDEEEELEEEDEEGMNIIVKKISITGKPQIVYTDSQDSLFARITMNSLSFDGHFETNAIHKTTTQATVDKLFIEGKYVTDTLAVNMDRVTTSPKSNKLHLETDANVVFATSATDLTNLPVGFTSDITIKEDPDIALSLENIKAHIAMVPITGHFDIKVTDEEAIMNSQLDITRCKVQSILHNYLRMLMPEAAEIQTDTEVSARAVISGAYNFITETMPKVEVSIDIPDSQISYSTFPEKVHFGLKADFNMDADGVMNTDIEKAHIHTYGLGLDTSFGITDITGEDPAITINGNLTASLDSLRKFLPDTLNITAGGQLSAHLDGAIKMSELDIYKFSHSELEGEIKGSNIRVQMPDEALYVKMDGLDIQLSPEYIQSRRNPDHMYRLMGITGYLASADVTYDDAFTFKGKGIEIGAKNSAVDENEDMNNVHFLGGHMNAEMLLLNDSEGTSIKLNETTNSFQMRPKRGQPTIPVISVSNTNHRITYATSDNRIVLSDSKITATAAMNTIDRQRRRKAFMDSLARVYPSIPRDSLFSHMRSQRSARAIPSWMKEESFKSSDIQFDLNETFKTYFREWDIEGSAGIRSGIVMTPYFPLRNVLRGTSLSFNNDKVSIDSLKVATGKSDLSAKGSLSGLRRALLGRGNIQLKLDITSNSVDADELLKAYTVGSQYISDASTESSKLTDDEFLQQITDESAMAEDVSPSLIVLPGNLNAKIDIKASGIRYKDLNISSFGAGIIVKERCAQLIGTSIKSNMGSLNLDAFYATKSKKDVRTGFCLDLKDVTSERVIALMPEIGEIMPMIGSIKGLLNCEIAATASLDTTMNLIAPSINGIARLSGKNLSISDDEVYTAVARKLLFRNKKSGKIDSLVVEGTIHDSRLEVFPFIFKIDRYTLALSGIQNLDMSYKHHVSVLRSPLLLRLGLNISGPDYDNMKFRLGRAQYRVKKMPSFTAVIDQTKNDLRYSIYNIFETGVEKTITNRDMHSLITKHRNDIGYINAAEIEIEELTGDELKKLEESENADAVLEEAIQAAVTSVKKMLKNN